MFATAAVVIVVSPTEIKYVLSQDFPNRNRLKARVCTER